MKREYIKLTEGMLLALLKGNEFHLISSDQEGELTEFIFEGPFDGVFLTHDQITQIQRNSEMSIFNMLEKTISEFTIKSRTEIK